MSDHASRCEPRSRGAGVHEARSSMSVVSGAALSVPKPSAMLRVAVPPAWECSAWRRSSASTSHVHATAPASWSSATSGSRLARIQVTARKPPGHRASGAGSCRRTNRPVASTPPVAPGPPHTSAARATAKGACPSGAGISRSRTSVRGRASRRSARARRNTPGGTGASTAPGAAERRRGPITLMPVSLGRGAHRAAGARRGRHGAPAPAQRAPSGAAASSAGARRSEIELMQ